MHFSFSLAVTISTLPPPAPQEGSGLSSTLQTLSPLGQASQRCCTRPHGLLGCGLMWAIFLRCVTKEANITNDNLSLSKQNNDNDKKNPPFTIAMHLCPFGFSGYPLMLLKMHHFISNCYMPGWFMCFCFSAFHRCLITQSCVLVRLYRFLPPCPAESPCWGSHVAAARIPCSHPSTAHVQPTQLKWSECAFSADELAMLQDFATPVLPSDVKCFVEEEDLNTSVRAEPSFISFVKGAWLFSSLQSVLIFIFILSS